MFRRRSWHKYELDADRHWARVWEDHWRGKSYASLLDEARRSEQYGFLAAELPASGAVLESGCGHGQWIEALSAPGRRVVGIDRFEPAPRRGLSVNPDLPIVIGDIERLPFADGAFRAVLSFGVLEHFEQGFAGPVREIDRVLAADGVLLVSVPYHSLLRRVLEPFRRAAESLRESPFLRRVTGRVPLPEKRFYQYAYTTGEFTRELAKHGFRTERVIHYDTEFGLTRDYPPMRWLRRRVPPLFRALHRLLRVVSPRITAHMQMHAARRVRPAS